MNQKLNKIAEKKPVDNKMPYMVTHHYDEDDFEGTIIYEKGRINANVKSMEELKQLFELELFKDEIDKNLIVYSEDYDVLKKAICYFDEDVRDEINLDGGFWRTHSLDDEYENGISCSDWETFNFYMEKLKIYQLKQKFCKKFYENLGEAQVKEWEKYFGEGHKNFIKSFREFEKTFDKKIYEFADLHNDEWNHYFLMNGDDLNIEYNELH